MGTTEDGLRSWPAVCHTRASQAGDHGLDRFLQPLTATFGAGLPQPDAVRTTLVGGAAKICRLMTGLSTPVFRGNLRKTQRRSSHCLRWGICGWQGTSCWRAWGKCACRGRDARVLGANGPRTASEGTQLTPKLLNASAFSLHTSPWHNQNRFVKSLPSCVQGWGYLGLNGVCATKPCYSGEMPALAASAWYTAIS